MTYQRWKFLKNNKQEQTMTQILELMNFERNNKKLEREYRERFKAEQKKIDEIMKIENTSQRQEQIARHLDLFRQDRSVMI